MLKQFIKADLKLSKVGLLLLLSTTLLMTLNFEQVKILLQV